MLSKTSTIACVALGASLLAARAHAQPEPDTDARPAAAAAASADGADQLTLPKGRLLLDAFAAFNLSSDSVFKPFSLSPDVWYGATDAVTVGLIHSGTGMFGFIGGAGQSLCLSGSGGNCADIYPNVGLEARYKLKTGTFALAAGGGLYVRHLSDPFQLALKLGAAGRWHSGKLAFEFEPNIFFGLTNRTPTAGGIALASNEETLDLPGTLFYAVTPMLAVALQTGFLLPLQNTGDNYAIPLSLGVHYRVNESFNVSLAFSLLKLIGGGSGTGFDTRSLTLGGTYAF